jgi:hypothetical protein
MPAHPLGRFRARVRPLTATILVTLVAVATLAAAGLTTGFARDLLLNVGATLVLVPPTYLVFSPIFERLRQTAAAIVEHARLDRVALTAGVRGSRWIVEVMATWSSMLEEEPYREPFLDALASALRGGAGVRILLLDPESIAVDQRTKELDGLDVRRLIGANLRCLHTFADRLDPAARRALEVRVYDAAPSMQLFRWDDKVLISFYPLHERVVTARQIETYVSNPLGEFAQSRFDELWAADTTRGIEDYLTMPVTVWAADAPDAVLTTARVAFVRDLDELFIDATPLVAHLVQHGIAGLRATVPDDDGAIDGKQALTMVQLASCGAEQRLRIPALFDGKYGAAPSPDVIVRLG